MSSGAGRTWQPPLTTRGGRNLRCGSGPRVSGVSAAASAQRIESGQGLRLLAGGDLFGQQPTSYRAVRANPHMPCPPATYTPDDTSPIRLRPSGVTGRAPTHALLRLPTRRRRPHRYDPPPRPRPRGRVRTTPSTIRQCPHRQRHRPTSAAEPLDADHHTPPQTRLWLLIPWWRERPHQFLPKPDNAAAAHCPHPTTRLRDRDWHADTAAAATRPRQNCPAHLRPAARSALDRRSKSRP